ncbi:SPOR domain-containing protein [Pseudomonas fluorescens]|uniref:SPOR domain-containing protein n=1 Tax=Pseudomonas fluorescens TaxID=294 RepID=A0A5E7FQH5_PSEFL|nr:SPOR domain-containing protein [Pseudomonas fluorescens]VVO41014.1 hypothetical protein PS691_05740 [Pseudomonas fluorescens]
MRKIGLGFMITGVMGQLSALVWTYTSPDFSCTTASTTPTSSQEQADSNQLPIDSFARTEADSNKAPLDSLSSKALTPPASLGVERPHPVKLPAAIRSEIPAYLDRLSQLFSSKLAIIIGGLIAIAGLLLTLFSRKKISATKLHIFQSKAGSSLVLEDSCLTCGGVIRHAKKPIKLSPPQGLWVIELTLNTQSRRRSIKVIQHLALPVIRREHDFIVIGPYRQKQEASYVLTDLSENYGVRGWLMRGN